MNRYMASVVAGRAGACGNCPREVSQPIPLLEDWCRQERRQYEAIVSSTVNGVPSDQDHLGIARRVKCWF